jgi:hypothetical protein
MTTNNTIVRAGELKSGDRAYLDFGAEEVLVLGSADAGGHEVALDVEVCGEPFRVLWDADLYVELVAQADGEEWASAEDLTGPSSPSRDRVRYPWRM